MSHETHRCARAGCSNDICLDPATVKRLRESHATFYCPLGHHNYFPDKTDQEKELERLREQLDWAERRIQWRDDDLDRARTNCIWTGCSFTAKSHNGLLTHMRATHGMPTLAAVREEQAS